MEFKNKALVTAACSVLAFGAFSALAADVTDGQIAEIMMTANKAEISAAKLAKSNSENKDVKGFAQHMLDEHSKNEKEGMKVTKKDSIKPEENETAATLKKDATAKTDDMKKLKGADFDKAYIAQQVDMHQQLLTDLDTKFIPAAKDPGFKSFLEDTAKHVKKHLELAQKLQTAQK